jgi:hypothetical protein
MELDHSTILQVNATMFVGILIFLSFSSSLFIGNIPSDEVNRLSNLNSTNTESESASMQSYLEQRGQSSQVYVTVLTLVPFAASCLIIGYYDYKHDEYDESEKRFRKGSMIFLLFGFAMLIFILLDLLLRNTFD